MRSTTTTNKAVAIGALVAVLVGAASSLATARVTDRQADLERLRVENSRFASQVSQQESQLARLASQVSQQEAQLAASAGQAGEGTVAIDRLNTEIAAMKAQIEALHVEKAGLEQQLSQVEKPAAGPKPTAKLTAKWVHRLYEGQTDTVVCVEIENTSAGDVSISYSYGQFTATDGADFAYPARLGTVPSMRIAFPLLDGQLGPGEKRRGQLLYNVPKTALLTKLVWNTDFESTAAVAVALPKETFLVVDGVIPGAEANDC